MKSDERGNGSNDKHLSVKTKRRCRTNARKCSGAIRFHEPTVSSAVGQEPTKVATVAHVADPQGAARSRLGVRVPPLRWASQEPTKVATVSQIAAPQGRRGLLGSPWDTPLLDIPGAHESGDSFAYRSPPK